VKRRTVLIAGAVLAVSALAVLIFCLWPRHPEQFGSAASQYFSTSTKAAKPCALGELAGDWLLFIHYDDGTATIDLTVDAQGRTRRASRAIAENLQFSFCQDGSLMLTNSRLRLKGRYNPAQGYLSGTAISGWPVPFSARRIMETK